MNFHVLDKAGLVQILFVAFRAFKVFLSGMSAEMVVQRLRAVVGFATLAAGGYGRGHILIEVN